MNTRLESMTSFLILLLAAFLFCLMLSSSEARPLQLQLHRHPGASKDIVGVGVGDQAKTSHKVLKETKSSMSGSSLPPQVVDESGPSPPGEGHRKRSAVHQQLRA
ncbi:hypothetical protein L6164_028789 [Bauhinia variegata]|uniref:Uncharacterized protein n=1 Tax=Bauhinia variegata TaxID=167791 RepID=A0ACB9L7X1_BAUVA|nr:hypothetical protein L6164_028789 [Bauhinia variegata]